MLLLVKSQLVVLGRLFPEMLYVDLFKEYAFCLVE